MTGLFIRIEQENGSENGLPLFHITCDNVQAESATTNERLLANSVERDIAEILKAKAGNGMKDFRFTQKEPDGGGKKDETEG